MSAKMVKLDEALMARIGATSEDFAEKFGAYVAESDKTSAELAAAKSAPKPEPKAEGMTEAKVKEIFQTEFKTAISGADTKAVIEAIAKTEASKVVIDTHAATGTLPAKQSPAPAENSNPAADLLKAGKFEEAYAASAELQRDFTSAKAFAAYARNAGSVKISTRN